jgi:putative ABC transport system ATP-binding protein
MAVQSTNNGGSLPVAIEGLRHFYGDGEGRKEILRGVSLSLEPGEVVILAGPSGSGKSTLLTLVGALRAVQSGSVRLFGTELRGASEQKRETLRRRIGFIFQSHNLLPFIPALDNVVIGLEHVSDITGQARRDRAARLLAAVGLSDQQTQMPATLSGGQKQRVAIARALAHDPDLILADEPTASLDRTTGHEIVALMRQLAKQRRCPVLLVTHDHRIYDVADRIVEIEDGQLVAGKRGV